MATSDNSRFTRCFWETPSQNNRWFKYAKGGGYSKWFGLEWLYVDWEYDGGRLNAFPPSVLRSREYYFQPGLTYTPMSGGALGLRRLADAAFDVKGSSLFPKAGDQELMAIAACLSSHVCSYLARSISRSLELHVGYLSQIPMPADLRTFGDLGNFAELIKHYLITSNPTEHSFNLNNFLCSAESTTALLHTVEGTIEKKVCNAYDLSLTAVQAVISDTGTPAGFYPLITGYDALPELPANLNLPLLAQEVIDYLTAHESIAPPTAELQRIKARLRGLYEAGLGVKESEEALEAAAGDSGDDEGEAAVSGAHIPIPTETFLEELSVKMQIHPISVYWLLEELRREGARCKPEEQRLLEDRLSVIVLRLLGHRWPKQIEAGEPVPSWADADGIIPISGSTGEQTLAERVRVRLRAEDGDLGAQRAEALLSELTGLSLEDWLRREFFKRHVRQFKYRPIAWQLASDPSVAVADAKAKKRLGGRRMPAFECLIYYHACGGDVLARIRTQYVEPLLRGARQHLEQASHVKDEDGAVQANMRIQELAEFNRRLQLVAERGFASPELDKLVANEPLDRWSGDGYLAPVSQDDLIRQEQAWRVDLNDGVRVNIAPVQLAGLLVSDVLKAADAKKAIADRARWRSDERRWVRAGKLPRCGWMPESVPESAEWTKLAPQREAERAKLEEKRRAIVERREVSA
jgi:hypothetical protein